MNIRTSALFFFLLIFVFSSSVILVLSQNGLEVILEARLMVISDTNLLDVGLHDFEVFGQGTISSPFSEPFTIIGSGTADYSIIGGFPPGEFTCDLNFSGTLSSPFFTGQIDLLAMSQGTTAQVITTPNFIRTEEVRDLSAQIIQNGFVWNLTSQISTIDFGEIDPNGKSFDITITWTFHLTLLLSPTPSPTVSPSPTPTPVASPTLSPSPTQIPTPTQSPSPTPSITPTPTSTPTATPTSTPEPESDTDVMWWYVIGGLAIVSAVVVIYQIIRKK